MLVFAACGGNDVDPRVIAGGGVGDGEIDGELNVYVIDTSTDAPIAGAMVQVGAESSRT
jgi:predicted secreted protein